MKACPLCRTEERSRLERHLNEIALLKCDSCGFVYADLPDELILQVNSEYTDEAEDHYQLHQTFLDDMWFRAIAERFTKGLGPGRVLDVGCGNGRLLSHFRRLGWTCYGVDTSPWSAKFADCYGFELFSYTIEAAASQISQIDLVVSTSTLEHIAQPVPHVQAIGQVLKPGGSAYFCGMPNYASLPVRLGVSTFHLNTPPSHVNFFTPQTLSSLFQFTGVSFHELAARTYGIPELHRVYRALVEILRGRRIRATRNAQAQASSPPSVSVAEPSSMEKVLGAILLSALYHCGRIGRAGDKLEALAVKSKEP